MNMSKEAEDVFENVIVEGIKKCFPPEKIDSQIIKARFYFEQGYSQSGLNDAFPALEKLILGDIPDMHFIESNFILGLTYKMTETMNSKEAFDSLVEQTLDISIDERIPELSRVAQFALNEMVLYEIKRRSSTPNEYNIKASEASRYFIEGYNCESQEEFEQLLSVFTINKNMKEQFEIGMIFEMGYNIKHSEAGLSELEIITKIIHAVNIVRSLQKT